MKKRFSATRIAGPADEKCFPCLPALDWPKCSARECTKTSFWITKEVACSFQHIRIDNVAKFAIFINQRKYLQVQTYVLLGLTREHKVWKSMTFSRRCPVHSEAQKVSSQRQQFCEIIRQIEDLKLTSSSAKVVQKMGVFHIPLAFVAA